MLAVVREPGRLDLMGPGGGDTTRAEGLDQPGVGPGGPRRRAADASGHDLDVPDPVAAGRFGSDDSEQSVT